MGMRLSGEQEKYSRVASWLQKRHLCYNRDIEELNRMEETGKAFIIRPSYRQN